MPQLANPIQLQKYLKGMDYPAKKKSLLDRARDEGADENVLYTLERLPDKEYDGPTGVTKEVSRLKKPD